MDDEIALDPRHPGDAVEMFAAIEHDRRDLRAWLPWVDATGTLGDVRRYAQFAFAQYQRGSAFDYAIRANGRLVGAIGLHDIDRLNCNAQIGYWLVPGARGRGIASRAVRNIVSYGFGSLHLRRLEIRCVTGNVRSRAVPERIGFTFEGILGEAYLLHDAFCDLALYAMTMTRWQR